MLVKLLKYLKSEDVHQTYVEIAISSRDIYIQTSCVSPLSPALSYSYHNDCTYVSTKVVKTRVSAQELKVIELIKV